jgi:pimeloyl-ACP methyl ester carboxylesterase
MPTLELGRAHIRYEEWGQGEGVLLLAPGGLNSTVETWNRFPIKPMNEYASNHRLVAMDQPNAGQSTGPIDGPPWDTYVSDQLALMSALGIERFHVIGCCIGSSFGLALAKREPQRILSLMLLQPIGIIPENRDHWTKEREEWAADLKTRRPELDPDQIDSFASTMWDDASFVGSVSEDDVVACQQPMLVMPGTAADRVHPRMIGERIAELAPHAELVLEWKEKEDDLAAATKRLGTFMDAHGAGVQ